MTCESVDQDRLYDLKFDSMNSRSTNLAYFFLLVDFVFPAGFRSLSIAFCTLAGNASNTVCMCAWNRFDIASNTLRQARRVFASESPIVDLRLVIMEFK